MSLAILDWKYPNISVFSAKGAPFPLPDLTQDAIPEIVEIAQITLQNRPVANTTNPTSSSSAVPRKRQQATSSSAPAASSSAPALNIPAQSNPGLPAGSPLLQDGAAGDPPSLGIAVTLAGKATNNAAVKSVSYDDAAQSQVDYLLYHVPRVVTGDAAGAISHRTHSVQLWADNVHMVPPFLAYHGVVQNNQTLVQEAYNQIKTYRAALQDSNTKLWRHMTKGPEADDPRLWATGNAWAAMGILRVHATIQRSQFADAFSSQNSDLKNWASEILTATKNVPKDNNLVYNYMDNATSFVDATATALLAAAGLRMSTMNLTNDYVDLSNGMLAAVGANVNSTGFLNNVTDPYSFAKPGNYSGEGQSFILMAYAAHNDWVAMGRPGNGRGEDPLAKTNAGMKTGVAGGAALAGLLAFVLL